MKYVITSIEDQSVTTRLEADSIGEKLVPAEAFYGVQSLRALENFPITDTRLRPEMITALAIVKKACAIANLEAGALDEKTANAIVAACDEIIAGKYHEEFIVDPIQGGAGTSMNMNANEVIANVAIHLMGGTKGDYSVVHPNDHVNFGQSTNDIIPSAGKLTALMLLPHLEQSLETLIESFNKKAVEFDGIIKMGRTQLQDAVPVRLGQEFKAYATATARGLRRIRALKEELYTLNMGATAIGTGLNADKVYFNTVTTKISELTGIPFVQANDLIDATQNIDSFSAVSGAIKDCALALSKIANDLRLMSSGPRTGLGEINLPAKQNGSSIMPGKVNPVIPEVVSQVAFRIAGNDMTISMAVEAGQLELNAFEPVAFDALFQSIIILDRAVQTLTVNCVDGITANEDRCRELLDNSVGMVTALCPHIGYAQAAKLAKEALATRVPIRKLIIERNILTEEECATILDPFSMTKPGISGEDLLEKQE